MCFKYLDLPPIPDELLVNSVSEFNNYPNIFRIPDYEYYKLYDQFNPDLQAFLKRLFPFDFYANYQVIQDGIAIHKDGRRNEAVNFIIDAGGEDATLNLYADDKQTVLHSEKVQPKRWHWIDVQTFHDVRNVTGTRFSLTVTPRSFSYKTGHLVELASLG